MAEIHPTRHTCKAQRTIVSVANSPKKRCRDAGEAGGGGGSSGGDAQDVGGDGDDVGGGGVRRVAYLRCDMRVMSVSGGRGRKGRQERNERKNRVRAGAAHLKLVVHVDWTMGRSPHTQRATPDPWVHHTHGQECRHHCSRKAGGTDL